MGALPSPGCASRVFSGTSPRAAGGGRRGVQKGELKLDFAFLYGDLVGYDLFVLIGHDEEVRRAAVADMLEATEGWPLVRARPEGE